MDEKTREQLMRNHEWELQMEEWESQMEEDIQTERHKDWPSDDLEDVGWIMLRSAIGEARRKWDLELFGTVRVYQKECLVTVSLYSKEIDFGCAFALSNEVELYFSVRQSIDLLVMPVIDAIAERKRQYKK